MKAHSSQRQPTKANAVRFSAFSFIFYSLFLLLRDSTHPTPRLQIRAGGGFTHHHQPPTITTTTTSPPAAPPAANDGQRRPTMATEGQRRPTKAHISQQRRTKANAGQRRQKGPKQRVWRRLGPRCVFVHFLFFILITCLLLRDSAHRFWGKIHIRTPQNPY